LAGPQAKRRPFLVVSDDAFNANAAYPKVLVVHLTTTRRTTGPFEWEVELPRGTAGLPRASVAKCQEIYTVFKAQLEGRAGAISRDLAAQVDRALAVALGLPSSFANDA
jgi:mRNA-degrading endonuclease toxin of MazEF toxin-antitoxin module